MFSWIGTSFHLPLAYVIINLDPILVHFGALAVHWYGLGYVVAICVGLAVLLRWSRHMGLHEDQIWNIFLWTAVAGLIGGRLYYVIQQPDLVSKFILDPINIIAVWNGGMAFFGAVFLGGVTLFLVAPRYGIDRWVALDAGALFALVAQIFGRFGNLVNGDIRGIAQSASPIAMPAGVCAHAPCIAYVANSHYLPWDIVYVNVNNTFAMHGIPYQPAPVYEMIANLIALACLFGLRYRLPRRVPGFLFGCYLAFYSIGQFVVFFFRDSEPYTPFLGVDGLKQAQWTAVFSLILAFGIMLVARQNAHPWLFTEKSPVPFPLPAGGLASVRAAAADTAPRMLQPVGVTARPATATVTARAKARVVTEESVASRIGIALKLPEGVVEIPPWQPTRARHGQLRNTFG